MKTKIVIQGQQSSVTTLLNKIQTVNSEEKKLQFKNVLVTFKTKKEAVKALSNAYQSLKEDQSTSYKRASIISYDAARAYIIKE
jgi:phosphohistidine swiveling domain-containing protein